MIKRTPWTIFNVFPLMVLWLAMVVASCSTISDDEPELVERVKVGGAVPSFTVNIVGPEGQEGTFSTTRLTGTTVIVFFNTSCKDCQRDLPLLNQYYLQHKDEPDFRMLAISREENDESVAAYWAANGLLIPYSPQEDRRIYNLFATSIIPRIYFCRDGIVTRIDIEKFSINGDGAEEEGGGGGSRRYRSFDDDEDEEEDY